MPVNLRSNGDGSSSFVASQPSGADIAVATFKADGSALVVNAGRVEDAQGRVIVAPEYIFDLRKFGPLTDDGTGNNYNTFAAAIASGERHVRVPPGTFLIDGELETTHRLNLVSAAGPESTVLRFAHVGRYLSCLTAEAVRFIGLQIKPLAGLEEEDNTGIFLDAPEGSQNAYSVIANCWIFNTRQAIDMGRAALYSLYDPYISGAGCEKAVSIRNLYNSDIGGGKISGGTLAPQAAGSVGIYQQSGGGLKLGGGLKILGAGTGYHLDLDYAASENDVDSSILIIDNVSIEQCTGPAIKATRQNASDTFRQLMIGNVQIGATNAETLIDFSGAGSWLSEVQINGLAAYMSSSGQTVIDMGSVADFNIGVATLAGTNTGGQTGIVCASGATGKISQAVRYKLLPTRVDSAAGAAVLAQAETIFFTPTVTFATPGDFAPTVSGSTVGRGRVVGNDFVFNIIVVFTPNASHTGSGNLRIGGLPFTVPAAFSAHTSTLTLGRLSNVTMAAGWQGLGAYYAYSVQAIELFGNKSAAGNEPVTATHLPSNGSTAARIEISGSIPIA